MTAQATIPAFSEGIRAQPENLEAGAIAVREAIDAADLRRLREGVLVLTGIGASWHALAPAVRALRAAGRRVFAVPSSELAEVRARNLADAFVVVSQSGASTETIAAMEDLDGAFVAAISAREDSPLSRAADVWLPLGPMTDTPVSTLSYTATLQTLGLLCDELLVADRGSEWALLPELVRQAVDRFETEAGLVAERFTRISSLDAIGGGPAVASAGETALLAREALLLPATGSDTRQFLHGPLESVRPGFGCILFGAQRELNLAASLVTYGAEVAVITERPVRTAAGFSLFGLPQVIDLAAPVLQILPVQLLVESVARLRGLEIGQLTRTQPDTKVT